MFDKEELKHAIKSFTGTTVSDEFIAIMQKQLLENGDQEIDFEEFRDSFLAMTRSLYPNQGSASRDITNPPSPPPSPYRSRSNSSSSTPTRLISPPNSPRLYDSSGSPNSGSPISSSPPVIYTISALNTSPTFSKPNPISPRRLSVGSRPRSSSLNGPPVSSNRSRAMSDVFSPPLPCAFDDALLGSSSNGVTSVPRNSDDEGSGGSSGSTGGMTLQQTISQLVSQSAASSPVQQSSNNHHHHNNYNNNHLNQQQKDKDNNSIQYNNHHPNLSHSNLQKKMIGLGHGIMKQTSDKDLFSTLLSLNPDAFKKKKAVVESSDSSVGNSASETEGDGNNSMFHMEREWVRRNTHKAKKNGKSKRKKKRSTSQRFTYKIKSSNGNGDGGDGDDEDSDSSSSDDEFDKEIGWATEEFYYDPSLTNLDDLHEVISILKEKYSISSTRVKELERRVQIALHSNGKLEEEKSNLQTDLIGISLKASALEKNKHSTDQLLGEKNTEIYRLQAAKAKEEKETLGLKKKLSSFEETLQKNMKQLESTMVNLEEKDLKHHQELESLQLKLNSKIDILQKDCLIKIEKEKEKFIDYCEMTELEKYNLEHENGKLKEMIESLNQQVNQLHRLYEEKQKEIRLSREDQENQTISHEMLSTEKLNLNNELESWKKRCQRMEAKKIADLQQELRRSKKEHSKFKSMVIQGIHDFQVMESSINLNQPNNNNNNSLKTTTTTAPITVTGTTTTTTNDLKRIPKKKLHNNLKKTTTTNTTTADTNDLKPTPSSSPPQS